MRQLYRDESLKGVIESAGTADWNVGQPASPLAVSVARQHGIDIREHRARQVCHDDFSRFDRIYAMDRDNQTTLKRLSPAESRHKITLLRGNADVSDPYSGTEEDYRQAFKIIEEACRKIAAQLSNKD
jgi:protein-tyrosine phosphatase